MSNYAMAIKIRETTRKDMMQIINLLKQISPYMPPKKNYDKIWSDLKKQTNSYSVVAYKKDLILAYGSITIERKIRGGKIGHIEDIVTHLNYQRKGIGKKILQKLYSIAKKKRCFKIILQCQDENIKFYNKCTFKKNGITMQRFIK